MMRACVAEMIATFTLTFIGIAAIVASKGDAALVTIALAHGIALAVAVYASGHISGGHVNPAVTVAMLVTGRIDAAKAFAYIVAQVFGALVAAYAAKSLIPGVETAQFGATLGELTKLGGAHLDPCKALVLEAIATFLLVTTIFGVAVDPRAPKNVYGFAIGLTIAMDIMAIGPLTGGSMNPARSIGPALVGGLWQFHWVYWAGPILGGCIAGLVYQKLLMSKSGEQASG